MFHARTGGIGAAIALAFAATACASSPTVITPSPPPAATTSPARITREVDVLVQLACEKAPEQVKRLIPGAESTFDAGALRGTTCIWRRKGDGEKDVHVTLLAVRPMDYRQYDLTLPGPKPVVELPGASGVTTDQLDWCTVVLDVDARALDVQVHGLKEPGCTQARAIAEQLVAARAPQSSRHQPPPQSSGSAPVSVQRSSP